MAIWGGYLQARKAQREQERTSRQELRQELVGLVAAVEKARTPNQFTTSALRLKDFFFRNPGMFDTEGNSEFFAAHLQEIDWDPRPAPQYWDDDRKGIKTDVALNVTLFGEALNAKSPDAQKRYLWGLFGGTQGRKQ